MSFPLGRDGEVGSALPLANDIFHSSFIAMEKTEDYPVSSFVLPMRINHPMRLSQIDRISVKLGTYFKSVRINSAELKQSGNDCRFTLKSAVDLPDGGFLDFYAPPCSWKDQSSFILTIDGSQIDGIAVLGYQGISETRNNPQIFAVDKDGKTMAAAGNFLPKKTGPQEYWPRLRLLAYMWNWADNWLSFALLVLGAFGLVSLSLAFLIGIIWQRIEVRPITFAFAAFSLIAALQVSYAFLSPPFQAPDEPDHFLTFSQIGGLSRAEKESLSLANQSHFDRLMCHVGEKFTKSDLGFAMEQTHWNEFHVGYVDVPSRSAYAQVVWPLIGQFFFSAKSSSEQVLLGLRIFNGFYFSLIFLTSIVIYLKSNAFDPIDYLYCLLLVPTLFHFSNHNSNHAFIISHYVPLTLAFRSIVTGRRLSKLVHLWIGLNLGLCLLSGRIGFVFLLAAYSCFVIRWIWIGLNADKVENRGIQSLIADFSFVVLPVAILIFVFRSSPYIFSQLAALRSLTGMAEVGIFSLIIGGAVAPFLAIRFGQFVNAIMKRIRIARFVKANLWAGLAILVMLLLLPIFKSVSPLLNIEYLNPNLSGWQYTLKVWKHFALSWGWGGHDFYLVESFWGGFGCPEPVVGTVLVQAIKGSLATMTVFGFYQTVKRDEWRLSFILILSFAILLGYLTLLAYASAAQPSNLHGRYMVGFYLLLIQTAILTLRGAEQPKAYSGWSAYAMVSMAVVQIASVWYLLGRYF
jgi:hypothetical protein